VEPSMPCTRAAQGYHGNLFEFSATPLWTPRTSSTLQARSLRSVSTSSAALLATRGAAQVQSSKNKTFFFTSFEGARVRQALTYLVSVPIADFKTGNFTQYPNRFTIRSPRASTTAGVLTRDQFPTTPSREPPRQGRAEHHEPVPCPEPPGHRRQLRNQSSAADHLEQFRPQIDQNFPAPKDQAFFRYSQHATDQNVPGSLPLPAVGNTAAASRAIRCTSSSPATPELSPEPDQ